MTEHQLTQEFQARLRALGFKVFKHADRFTKGIPDTSASRDRATWWLEFKAIRRREFAVRIDWSKILTKDDMVQLANMIELEKKAIAMYVLFQILPYEHSIHLLSPTNVAWSYHQKQEIPLPAAFTLDELERLWRK